MNLGILLFVVNVDWFLLSHRREILESAVKLGYRVIVATEVTTHKNELIEIGVEVIPLKFSRNGFGIISTIKLLIAINHIISNFNPDIIHCVTLKASIIGGLAAYRKSTKKIIMSITGMGYVFSSDDLIAKLISKIILYVGRLIFTKQNTIIIVQNKDDQNLFENRFLINKNRIILIQGSGVNFQKFNFSQISNFKSVIMVGRFLKEKGVREYVAASKTLAKYNIKCVLVGDIDVENRGSMSKSWLNQLYRLPYLKTLPFSNSIYEHIMSAGIVVIPSYREGFPRVALEASAVGRPIITTNVPGCRDSVVEDETGVLIIPRSADAIVHAVLNMVDNPEKMKAMGVAANKRAINNFDIRYVIKTHLDIYSR